VGAPPTTVVEQDIDLGRWTTATRAAHPSVEPLLARGHVGFRQDRAEFAQWLEPPQPALTLIVSLDGSLRADGAVLPAAWIAGLSAAPSLVEHGGAYEAIDLKLTPLGAYRLLGIPLCELAGQTVELESVFGRNAPRLVDRLLGTPDWDKRFDLLDAFLAAHAGGQASGSRQAASEGVAWAWSELHATGGRVRIEALAAQLGWSRRRLAKEFQTHVGVPAKTAARLIRFAELRRRLDEEPVRWADIAYDCGYCDQSHLIRDFRELAGITPTDFLARRTAGGSVVGDGLTFVQDSEAKRS
jgi:AraC-like DNA-binding protein